MIIQRQKNFLFRRVKSIIDEEERTHICLVICTNLRLNFIL